MEKLKHTLKKAAAVLTAAVMSISMAAPVSAETPTEKVAVLTPGMNIGTGGSFASSIATLAGGEENVQAVRWSETAPAEGTTTKEMSVIRSSGITSNTSAKAWFDAATGTIYLYSKADKVYMNPNCSGLFYNYMSRKNFPNLSVIDLGKVDWSLVTNMSHAFYQCTGLRELDLTKFNGTLTTASSYQNMISESAISTLKLGDSWHFTGPIGMDGNWTVNGSSPVTSYKIEMSGQYGGGTYVRSPGNVQDDSGEIYQAYGDYANNAWEIHDVDSRFTAFCIDADSHSVDDYNKNPNLEPDVGAGIIYGYYTKEKADVNKLVNGISGDHLDSSIGYLNSDNTGYEPLGSNMKEALITLLYYGPKIYDITTDEGYTALQHDIWHFTNRYSLPWENKGKWEGKTFESIPNHDSYELYVYVSKANRQNIITTESIYTPETPKHDVKILKTTSTKDSQNVQPLAKAKLNLTGPKSFRITSGTQPATVSVPAGDYTLSETEAPKGYQKADNVKFTVTKEGKIMQGDQEVEMITMQDAAIRSKVTIKKIDDAGNAVKGASLKLTCSSTVIGATVKPITFTTNASGTTIATLYPGTYTLSEETTPEGYEKAPDIRFSLGIDGKITIDGKALDAVTMVDRQKTHTVKISKQDIAGEEIDGAKLSITGATLKEAITWTSSKSAPHSVELPAGTYTLTETTAPNGYAVSEAITFTVAKDGKVAVANKDVNGTVVMTDRYADVNVNISKQDIAGKEIKGATLRIEGKTIENKDFSTSFTSDGEKPHTVALQPGKYTLTETLVPSGYEKAEAITFSIDKAGKVTIEGKEVSQIVMVDQYEKKTVEISKQDIAGKEINGATLTVTGKTDQGEAITPIVIKTDGKTTHKITVYPGTYELTETIVPNGYVKAESIQFVVKADGTIVSGKTNVDKIVMVDKYSDQTIKISKQDINGNEIAGAKLTITHKEDGKTITDYSWVSEEGKNKEVVLPAGEYILHETGAPDGYVKASDITFVVSSDGKVTINDKRVDTVVMTDKFTSVSVSKVDSDKTSTLLAGAKLQILDSGKKVVEEWTTDTKAHKITGVLAAGKTYTLHEVSAPEGYAVADDISFTVTTGAKTIVMKDKKIVSETGTLTVRKVDSANTSKYVAGAKLQLLDADKKVVEEWTTDSKEHVVKATLTKNAKYTVHEETAPSGYEKAADITFTMTEKNKIVIMKDKAIETTGKVTVLKVKYGDEKTYVSGAKLQILDSNKKVVEEWTTNSSSHVVSAKLTSGQKYTLHEVSAPNGYEVASDITFTASTKDQTLTMKDKATEVAGKVTVLKVKEGEEKTYVKGAKLQILDSAKSVVDEWTTDSSSHVVSGALKIGQKYTLHEVSAPDGYEVADDISFTVSTKDQTITMKDKELAVIKIQKVDEDGKALSGAKLQILDENNGIIDEWTTDGTDHVVSAKLSKGTYKLHEVSAPEGYEVAEDISFTYPQTDSKTITMTDKKKSAPAVTTSNTVKNAPTGDASNLPLMAAGIAACVAALGIVFLKRKKK